MTIIIIIIIIVIIIITIIIIIIIIIKNHSSKCRELAQQVHSRGSHAFTHTVTSTQLQPLCNCAKRQLSYYRIWNFFCVLVFWLNAGSHLCFGFFFYQQNWIPLLPDLYKASWCNVQHKSGQLLFPLPLFVDGCHLTGDVTVDGSSDVCSSDAVGQSPSAEDAGVCVCLDPPPMGETVAQRPTADHCDTDLRVGHAAVSLGREEHVAIPSAKYS